MLCGVKRCRQARRQVKGTMGGATYCDWLCRCVRVKTRKQKRETKHIYTYPTKCFALKHTHTFYIYVYIYAHAHTYIYAYLHTFYIYINIDSLYLELDQLPNVLDVAHFRLQVARRLLALPVAELRLFHICVGGGDVRMGWCKK